MKKIILFLLLCCALNLKAQEAKKSGIISKEIRELELENNKIVLDRYLADNTDTSRTIPIFNLGNSFVCNIILRKNNATIKLLDEELKIISDKRDSLRKLSPEFEKFYFRYLGSSEEERKKMGFEYAAKRKEMERDYPEYIKADKSVTANRSKYSRLAVQILRENFHSRNEVLPLTFIPYAELNAYNNEFQVKENQTKIHILQNIHRKALQEELEMKYK